MPANAIASSIAARRPISESSVRSVIVRMSNRGSSGSILASSARTARVTPVISTDVRIAKTKPRAGLCAYGK